jgi:ClpP class serine protease
VIGLAADEIVMDSHAVLGPVDPQLGEFPEASLVKAVRSLRYQGGVPVGDLFSFRSAP